MRTKEKGMAGKKKKAAKKSAKKKAKKVVRKAKRITKKTARKAATRKTTRKTAARKTAARKTAKAAKRPARKKAPQGEYGEGNYKASQRFRKSEEAFVERNRDNIPAMGREAEAALDGPQGAELMNAEAAARAHAAGQG
jgi:hypothetical protein